jgi:hypothetical protein
MPRVGFQPTIPAFERAKTVHALDRAAGHCDRHLYSPAAIKGFLDPSARDIVRILFISAPCVEEYSGNLLLGEHKPICLAEQRSQIKFTTDTEPGQHETVG